MGGIIFRPTTRRAALSTGKDARKLAAKLPNKQGVTNTISGGFILRAVGNGETVIVTVLDSPLVFFLDCDGELSDAGLIAIYPMGTRASCAGADDVMLAAQLGEPPVSTALNLLAPITSWSDTPVARYDYGFIRGPGAVLPGSGLSADERWLWSDMQLAGHASVSASFNWVMTNVFSVGRHYVVSRASVSGITREGFSKDIQASPFLYLRTYVAEAEAVTPPPEPWDTTYDSGFVYPEVVSGNPFCFEFDRSGGVVGCVHKQMIRLNSGGVEVTRAHYDPPGVSDATLSMTRYAVDPAGIVTEVWRTNSLLQDPLALLPDRIAGRSKAVFSPGIVGLEASGPTPRRFLLAFQRATAHSIGLEYMCERDATYRNVVRTYNYETGALISEVDELVGSVDGSGALTSGSAMPYLKFIGSAEEKMVFAYTIKFGGTGSGLCIVDGAGFAAAKWVSFGGDGFGVTNALRGDIYDHYESDDRTYACATRCAPDHIAVTTYRSINLSGSTGWTWGITVIRLSTGAVVASAPAINIPSLDGYLSVGYIDCLQPGAVDVSGAMVTNPILLVSVVRWDVANVARRTGGSVVNDGSQPWEGHYVTADLGVTTGRLFVRPSVRVVCGGYTLSPAVGYNKLRRWPA